MSEPLVCLFTTIRASLADTLAFANYHLNIGVDHIYMFFDDPDDPAVDVLDLEERVTCIRCDAGYWANLAGNLPKSGLSINVKQEINSQVAMKISREESYSWICHIDGDELIYAAGGFKKAIAALPLNVQVARFPVLEAIPEKLSAQLAFQELSFFKLAPVILPKNRSIYFDPRETILFYMNKIIYKTKKIRANLLGCNRASKDYIKGHKLGKSIARTNAPFVSFLSHFPKPAEHECLRINLLPEVKLLHFDSPDYDHWKTKWYIRYRNIQNGILPVKMSVHRRQQYEQFTKVYEQGNEEDLIELYKNTYFISASDRIILQKTGLISEIHLPDELFASASDHYRSESAQA